MWLKTLSAAMNIPSEMITSPQAAEKSISLNRNLLFLPGKMARYVLVHELCHLEHPDHSTRFWDLVERYVRGSREMSSKTMRAGVAVPEWAKV